MAQQTVQASSARGVGSGPARRLRAEGQIPGVLYGLDSDPVAVSVSYAELRDTLKGPQGMNTVFSLDVDGKDSETVIVRDVQRDPIKRVVTHADFLRVDPNQTIRVSVPLKLIGDDSGVTNDGGLIEQNLFELEIESLPGSVPTVIEADVTSLTLDSSISVADLDLPEGVVAAIADEISVASPYVPREVEEPAAVVDGVEGAEGVEGAAGAEGAEGEGGAEGSGEGESSGEVEGSSE